MRTNTKTKKKYDQDSIFDAVVEKMTAKGKGFFIISCGAWVHPLNTVLNCYAIMFDGSIQYKFEVTMDGFKAAEIRSTHYLSLPLTVGATYTPEELVKIIQTSS
jgi:hypothetical protein